MSKKLIRLCLFLTKYLKGHEIEMEFHDLSHPLNETAAPQDNAFNTDKTSLVLVRYIYCIESVQFIYSNFKRICIL